MGCADMASRGGTLHQGLMRPQLILLDWDIEGVKRTRTHHHHTCMCHCGVTLMIPIAACLPSKKLVRLKAWFCFKSEKVRVGRVRGRDVRD